MHMDSCQSMSGNVSLISSMIMYTWWKLKHETLEKFKGFTLELEKQRGKDTFTLRFDQVRVS